MMSLLAKTTTTFIVLYACLASTGDNDYRCSVAVVAKRLRKSHEGNSLNAGKSSNSALDDQTNVEISMHSTAPAVPQDATVEQKPDTNEPDLVANQTTSTDIASNSSHVDFYRSVYLAVMLFRNQRVKKLEEYIQKLGRKTRTAHCEEFVQEPRDQQKKILFKKQGETYANPNLEMIPFGSRWATVDYTRPTTGVVVKNMIDGRSEAKRLARRRENDTSFSKTEKSSVSEQRKVGIIPSSTSNISRDIAPLILSFIGNERDPEVSDLLEQGGACFSQLFCDAFRLQTSGVAGYAYLSSNVGETGGQNPIHEDAIGEGLEKGVWTCAEKTILPAFLDLEHLHTSSNCGEDHATDEYLRDLPKKILGESIASTISTDKENNTSRTYSHSWGRYVEHSVDLTTIPPIRSYNHYPMLEKRDFKMDYEKLIYAAAGRDLFNIGHVLDRFTLIPVIALSGLHALIITCLNYLLQSYGDIKTPVMGDSYGIGEPDFEKLFQDLESQEDTFVAFGGTAGPHLRGKYESAWRQINHVADLAIAFLKSPGLSDKARHGPAYKSIEACESGTRVWRAWCDNSINTSEAQKIYTSEAERGFVYSANDISSGKMYDDMCCSFAESEDATENTGMLLQDRYIGAAKPVIQKLLLQILDTVEKFNDLYIRFYSKFLKGPTFFGTDIVRLQRVFQLVKERKNSSGVGAAVREEHAE